jgi:hypothetical protein
MSYPVATLMRDLWLHLKRVRCLIRRRHLAPISIGQLQRNGRRSFPLYQCAYCTEIWLRDADWQRAGGKVQS